MSRKKKPLFQDETADEKLNLLLQKAVALGASESAIIDAKKIKVEDQLARRCVDPKCINYGLSPSCPPNVGGPSEFRNLQKSHTRAVVIRIIVPSAVLFSDQSSEIFRLLHEIVSTIEHEADAMGYTGSRAFAGGSCKKIFCDTYLECQRLSEDGPCRHPEHARPSMSGFGINVFDLIKKCGWRENLNSEETKPDDKVSWVAGLIMIA